MSTTTRPLEDLAEHDHGATVVISNIWPSIEGGRYPVKRVSGEPLRVFADLFKDGHDQIAAVLRWRKRGKIDWRETPMKHVNNDRWEATCEIKDLGRWEFTVEAWSDHFETWLHDFRKKFNARAQTGDSLETEIIEGAMIIEESARIAAEEGGAVTDAKKLRAAEEALRKSDAKAAIKRVDSPALQKLMRKWTNRSLSTVSEPHAVVVERERAQFSAWYEFFPRGAEGRSDKHSTFRDCVERLKYARDMGFDVVYFPPIHPIGETFRKGKDNSLVAEQDDPGSPWAIGNKRGGHRKVEPKLGTMKDFEWLVREAKKLGLEIAMDFAIQCSPDHPYVKEHPEWFFHRPDGTIKYAENPPKKYQDIYPINFHCESWRTLWEEMVDLVRFWIGKGVKIFRVDNPHTKPFSFWEYLIGEIQAGHPDVIFLAEAFTRPKMMQMLGKIGFSQSYTYFTWRTTKQELTDYTIELTQTDMREFYRGNFWPNTPDILVPPLVNGPPAAFKIRAALAASLMPSWGLYSGFEFCENQKHPDRDEYLHNEKYELKDRDWNQKGNIKAFITRLNKIRNENPAFRGYSNVRFCDSGNENIIAFAKATADFSNIVIVVVNLDPRHAHEGLLEVPLTEFGLPETASYQVHDLMYDESHDWHGRYNYIGLNPVSRPVHFLKIDA